MHGRFHRLVYLERLTKPVVRVIKLLQVRGKHPQRSPDTSHTSGYGDGRNLPVPWDQSIVK